MPEPANRRLIAEVWPCPCDDFDEHACAANLGLPCETDDEPDNLAGTCRGDGTRIVVTDIEVEGPIAAEPPWDKLMNPVWREVKRCQ